MQKNIVYYLIFLSFWFHHNAYCSGQLLGEQLKVLETYDHAGEDVIVETIKKSLQSKNVLEQDAGCILLLKAFERLKKNDGTSERIFAKLSGDQKFVICAADIIDSRLLGWYNPGGSEQTDNDIKIYVPLFFVLGKANNKTARGTLIRSMLYLRSQPQILKIVPMSEELASISIQRLEQLKNRLCCIFPGKDAAAELMEKDYRYCLLGMFEKYLNTNHNPCEKMKRVMKPFIIDCLNYGNSKNGYVIRAKAARMAGILAEKGEKDLFDVIRKVAQTDPYYVHAHCVNAGYSLKALHYPIREICSKILLQQKSNK